MPRWPWPEREVQYFKRRCKRALGDDHPERRTLTARFISHLATHGEPDTDGPIENLRDWAKQESNSHLRNRLLSFDLDWRDVSRLAQAEAGMPNRRGDIVQIRSKAFWWEMRTK